MLRVGMPGFADRGSGVGEFLLVASEDQDVGAPGRLQPDAAEPAGDVDDAVIKIPDHQRHEDASLRH